MVLLDKIDQSKPELYEGSIMYVSTEPCPMCTSAADRMQKYVSMIVYGCSAKTFAKYSKNSRNVSKLLIRDKEITKIALDAKWQTADVNINNNYWPARPIKSRFDLYKEKKKDMMRDYNEELKDISAEKVNDK